ncbi:glycerophosphodiester phosphodiesterase family protein [Erythrobacter sp. YT30]|uniref:glycerophosphodiester phosphodiesterase family protein n=1 Tax=Erythrobacter sp. YT30 TaxID=1735012 RepID=UPI0018D25D01|nr:glycerophosphodiester phosphodiesterase family protein [Erythrobacter sp. YT30]
MSPFLSHAALSAAIAIGLGTTALGQNTDNASGNKGTWHLVPETTLSAMLDCIEQSDTSLISAHRGGPSPGLPENSVETMDALLTAIPAVMEIDVAQSPDGVHYLMHDRTLDRTTTGTGNVTDAPWSEVQKLFLVDEAGWVTPYRVPTLNQALSWAIGRTVLQIDFKRTADYEEVIELIRAQDMAESVILIAYSVEAAQKLYALAPEMLISFSLSAPGDLDEVVAAGIPADRIVAFTGTRTAKPDLYQALDEADVEVIFGTLGRSPNSIDNIIDRFGIDERYAELSEGGVDVIATDRPREAAAALSAADRLPKEGRCGVRRASNK